MSKVRINLSAKSEGDNDYWDQIGFITIEGPIDEDTLKACKIRGRIPFIDRWLNGLVSEPRGGAPQRKL